VRGEKVVFTLSTWP